MIPENAITYDSVDKSKWGEGAWNAEPDKMQWVDEETGLDCLAVRQTAGGHWCGYVGVDKDHPLYRHDYDGIVVDVHGGLTYSDACMESADPSRGVCHVPQGERPADIWWLGFDCAHCNDLSPGFGKYSHFSDESYRTLGYVVQECARLAKQLRARAK